LAAVSDKVVGVWVRPAVRRDHVHDIDPRERIAENAQIFDFQLSDEDIAELDALDRTGGTDRALEHKWW
jgi:hypothetical protein